MSGLTFLVIYAIGFIITLLVLIKWGKSKFGLDFDEPKTYVNYDDYDSSAQAYIWYSIGWIILVPMSIVFFSFNRLEKFVQKLINKNNE